MSEFIIGWDSDTQQSESYLLSFYKRWDEIEEATAFINFIFDTQHYIRRKIPMAVPNKYAIREIPLATFYDLKTGKARIQLSDLKSTGIENAGETVYAQGGRGNSRIVGFSGNRTASLTLQDAVFTNEVLAMMSGNDIQKGATNIYQRDELVIAADKANLRFTPATTGALISVYKLNEDGTHGEELTYAAAVAAGKYSVTGKAISLNVGEVPAGGKIVAYYQVKTDATANKITISSDKFAGSFRVVLDCLVRDVVTKQDFAAQIVINNAKMEDNWSIEMAPDGDPSVFDIPLEVLKPANSTEMYTMTVYDEGLLT